MSDSEASRISGTGDGVQHQWAVCSREKLPFPLWAAGEEDRLEQRLPATSVSPAQSQSSGDSSEVSWKIANQVTSLSGAGRPPRVAWRLAV